eukprot:m.65942 g.65942  ORF g.65942 m.65942 type:complete len:177 (+) comp12082_c1_seq2:1455-1985(+)
MPSLLITPVHLNLIAGNTCTIQCCVNSPPCVLSVPVPLRAVAEGKSTSETALSCVLVLLYLAYRGAADDKRTPLRVAAQHLSSLAGLDAQASIHCVETAFLCVQVMDAMLSHDTDLGAGALSASSPLVPALASLLRWQGTLETVPDLLSPHHRETTQAISSLVTGLLSKAQRTDSV